MNVQLHWSCGKGWPLVVNTQKIEGWWSKNVYAKFKEKKIFNLRANSRQQSNAISLPNLQAKGLNMISRQPAYGV